MPADSVARLALVRMVEQWEMVSINTPDGGRGRGDLLAGVFMIRVWTVFLLCLSWPLAVVAVAPSVRPLTNVANQVADLLAQRDFKRLDKLAAAYRDLNSLAEDGQPNLFGLYEGLSRIDADPAKITGTEEQWEAHRRLLSDWSEASPTATAPLIALARLKIHYAWKARGSGYSSTVSEQAYALMKERMAAARQQLETMPIAARGDPQWYVAMMSVALGQGWSTADFDALFEEAMKKFPDYLGFYFEKAVFYSPKWYGSANYLNEYIYQATHAQGSRVAPHLYARIYWYLNEVRSASFQNGVSWPEMKASYEALMKDYPSDWNRNSYAKHACMASDLPVLRAQLALIGDRQADQAWNGDHGFYERCKAMGEGKTCRRSQGTGEYTCL